MSVFAVLRFLVTMLSWPPSIAAQTSVAYCKVPVPSSVPVDNENYGRHSWHLGHAPHTLPFNVCRHDFHCWHCASWVSPLPTVVTCSLTNPLLVVAAFPLLSHFPAPLLVPSRILSQIKDLCSHPYLTVSFGGDPK